MAYNALNNLIDAYIYANGVQAITGQILNGVLKQMVSQLGSGYHLMGVAGPETEPASNDYAMAYFAATAGEYTDFGGITLAAGEVAVLLTSGNGSWSKQTIYNVPTGTADLENTAEFITNAVTDLVNYYTKTEIDTTLANYPTLEALATALADYYTKTEIDTQKAETDAALADRYTKSETDTALADYYKKTETYDKDEVDSIVATLSRQEYIVAWDGSSAPDVTAIPAGVTVTYSGTTYTGTLAASASTVNKIYMVWNGTAYDMYGTSQDGGYSWVPMGTTTVDLSQYATKAEVSQLEAEVDTLNNKTEDTIIHSKNYADFASVMNGLYPSRGGLIVENQNSTSIKFLCKPSTTYTISKTLTNRFRICYFNTEPIIGAVGGGVITSNAETALTITTIADSKYIVIYVNDSSAEGSKAIEDILASLQIEVGSQATEYEAPYWTAVDKTARSKISNIESTLASPIHGDKIEIETVDRYRTDFIHHDTGTNLIDIGELAVGYINAQGNVVENEGFHHTDYVRVNAGVRLYMDLLYTGYYAFYDGQKNLVEGHGNDSSIVDRTFVVPSGSMFARFTVDPSVTTYDDKIWLNTVNKKPRPYKDSLDIKLLPEKKYCDYEGNEISVFNKILCIGDSLTEGVFNHRDSGHTEYETYPQYSYPTFLQKLTNVECVNKGVASMTSVQWYSYFQNKDIWTGYDAAIIQLGVNDAGAYSGWSQDSETAFINIITKLQTENKNIKIFVATIMPEQSYSGPYYDAVSSGIRALVASLDDPNVILVDMAEYSHTGDSPAYDCGHLSAIGYHRLAQDYKNIISYYIATNLMDFQEVQFIGTNYWYNNPLNP